MVAQPIILYASSVANTSGKRNRSGVMRCACVRVHRGRVSFTADDSSGRVHALLHENRYWCRFVPLSIIYHGITFIWHAIRARNRHTETISNGARCAGPLHACPSTRYAYMIHARYQMPVYKEILSLISNRITTADIKKKSVPLPIQKRINAGRPRAETEQRGASQR